MDHVKLSQKRREVECYTPVKRALIFAPEKTEQGVISYLKRALPFLLAIALSIPVGLIIQHIVTLYGGPPHELPIDHAYIPLFAFMAGVVFAILTLTVIEWLIKTMREKRK